MLSHLFQVFQGLYTLFTGDPVIGVARLLLIALAFLFIYPGYRQVLEPLLMVPTGIGMPGVNGGVLLMEASHQTLFLKQGISAESLFIALALLPEIG